MHCINQPLHRDDMKQVSIRYLKKTSFTHRDMKTVNVVLQGCFIDGTSVNIYSVKVYIGYLASLFYVVSSVSQLQRLRQEFLMVFITVIFMM